MHNWDYDNAYQRHPIQEGVAIFEDGSALKTHDIFDSLPRFMRSADALFIDPPWTMGNMTSFYTKAGMERPEQEYSTFLRRLFSCIWEIEPFVCYVEMGKDNLADCISMMREIFPHVTFYNSTYYHRSTNLCYVVRGSQRAKKPRLDGLDEEDIIKWVCENEEYSCIGDLCMGRGLVAVNAAKAGRRFVGTELNHKRLAVALEKVYKLGKEYTIKPFF